MKKLLFILSVLLLWTHSSWAQLSGTKNIPGDYTTITLAVTDLNASGVGAGGVTFNVAAGYTETISAPISITATGTLANPIIFQKSGAGANPLITAFTGTATPSTAVQDGIWNLVGSDYVTINGIDLTDPNAANPATMEYGYAMFKASITDGCQNNTIKNCVVTLKRINNASGTAPAVEGSRAISIMNALVTTQTTVLVPTAASGSNSFNKIYGNTLQNCNYGIALIGYAGTSPFTLCDFGNDIGGSSAVTGNNILNFGGAAAATNPSAGVRTLAQYDLNVSYNTVNNNNGSGVNHPSTLRGIYLNTATSASATISHNTLTMSSGATTSQLSVIESAAGSTAAGNIININNNTIQNCSWPTATSGLFYGIYNTSSAFTVNIFGNNISNMSIPNTGNLYGIAGQSPVNLNIYNNEISNITKTVSGTLYAIQGATAIVSVHDNNIHDLTMTGGANAVYGYYNLSSPVNETYYNNTMHNFTCNGTGGVFGIYTNTVAGVRTVYSNTIYNLAANGGGPVYGIYGAASSPTIYKNILYNLSSGNAGGIVYGIYHLSGATANIYNNFISDLRTPAATGIDAIRGIFIGGGTTVNVFYNTVYLNATSTGATFGSSAMYANSTPTVDMRNNIFVNVSTPNGTGITAAYRRSSTTLTTYSANSNANAFYAGATEDATHAIYYDGTLTYNMVAFKALAGPRDANSFRELPPFNNVAATPYNLHLSAGTPTQCESGALVIAAPFAITTDFDGDVRNTTSPDIGADEGAFTVLDLTPPTITYFPLYNTSSTGSRTLDVTITDPSGVGSGVNQPVLYWKINAAATYTGPMAPTSINGSMYTYTFGAGVVLGDVVSYFAVAQDGAATPNIASYPAGATLTINPPLASSGPTTPSSYTIIGTICGNKTIGTGGDYPTITAALAVLNANELCGPIVYTLLDATYPSETFPLAINLNPGSGATNTILIKPAPGVSADISGVTASGAIFRIMTGYTTIEGSNTGGTSRNLTFSNTSTTSPAVISVHSTNTVPLVGITLKNCTIINGANTASAITVTNTAGAGGYFNNVTIQNNSIQRAYIGIYANAAVIPGNGSGLLITGNDLSTAGANSIRLVGIYAQGVDGVTITNNLIGNIVNANAESPKGIWIATGTNSAIVSGNTISNLTLSNVGAYALTGIYVNPGATAASISIDNNTVSTLSNAGTSLAFAGILAFSPNTNITNNSVSGLTQVTSGAFWGIVQNGAVNSNCSNNIVSGLNTSTSGVANGINIQGISTGVNISKNKIFNIKNTNASGYTSVGLALASTSTTANITASNNLIYDIASYGYASQTTDNGYGINIYSGGGYNLYFNSVNMATNQTLATGVPACLIINTAVTTLNSLDIRNNIFAIPATMGTNRYAVLSNAALTTFAEINYNDYYTSGPNLGYIGATDRADLTAWRIGSGKDANSVNVDPQFVSATDLHTTVQGLNNTGVHIPSITTDYANVTRSNPPDIGAYEFTRSPNVTTLAASGITGSGAVVNGNVTAENESVTTGFDYGLTTDYGMSVNGVPAIISGIAATDMQATITGLLPNTLYNYRAKGTANAVAILGSNMTFTTGIIAPTAITQAASMVTGTGAQLNGTVNANNAATTVTFEYGLTNTYGNTVTADQSPLNGYNNNPVSFTVSGLDPNTLYHFRVVASNSAGPTNGADLTFTTATIAPTAVTVAASPVGFTSATLNGNIIANNLSTTVSFEYGLTATYGLSVAAVPGTVTGMTGTSVSANLAGLLTGSTYHFRVVATNAAGTSYGSDLSFLTGCPQPGNAGIISGPAGVCKDGTGYVYTVPVIANAVNYTWTLPVGFTILSGNNTNEITVGVSGTAVSGNITVFGSSLCGSGESSSFAVTVNDRPTPTLNGPAVVCSGSTGNVYTTESGMTGYVWIVSAGGTITAGGTANSNTVTVSWNTPGAQSVSVNYINTQGCPANSATVYAVTVNALPAPTISGNNLLCQDLSAVYTTQAGMTDYVWSVTGGTITAGAGTNAITVLWTTAGAQTVSVNYDNINGCSAAVPASYAVTILALPVPIISGPPVACENSLTLTYTTEAGMSDYVWEITPNSGSLNQNGSNTVTVYWTEPGENWISVTYSNPNGCDASIPTVYDVYVSPLPATAELIEGSAALCAGSNGVTYSVPSDPNTENYIWTIPADVTIVSGSGTNSITVDFAMNAVSGNFTYYGENNCGTSEITTLAVTVNPIPATPVITADMYTLTSNAAEGNQWYRDGIIIDGAVSHTFDVIENGIYTVIVTLNDCSSEVSNSIEIVNVGLNEINTPQISIYPNPNSGAFWLTITLSNSTTFEIEVLNRYGSSVYKTNDIIVSGTFKQFIDLRNLAAGVYSIVLKSDSHQIIRKIVIDN
jgi:hypothetical protein